MCGILVLLPVSPSFGMTSKKIFKGVFAVLASLLVIFLFFSVMIKRDGDFDDKVLMGIMFFIRQCKSIYFFYYVFV